MIVFVANILLLALRKELANQDLKDGSHIVHDQLRYLAVRVDVQGTRLNEEGGSVNGNIRRQF